MEQSRQSIRENENAKLSMGLTEHDLHRHARSEFRGWRLSIRTVVARLQQWRQLQRERAELHQLDKRSLRDMGITRIDALQESEKPFWRE